jgi:hypothetical protein
MREMVASLTHPRHPPRHHSDDEWVAGHPAGLLDRNTPSADSGVRGHYESAITI